MRYLITVVVLMLLFTGRTPGQEDKDERKIKAAIDKEELRFRKNKEHDPGNAEIYWQHANNLAAFNTEFARAQPFFKKALETDSTNAAIYKDYGRYLYERLSAPDDAKIMFTKGLQYNNTDEELKKYLAAANTAIEKRDDELKLRDFGKAAQRELNAGGRYASMANFDSLMLVLQDRGSEHNYLKLLKRFLADDALAPCEMYLLIIGYAVGRDYNPFNYNDISAMKQMAAYSIDSAINRGTALVDVNPLNPTLNRELMYYYRKKNDTATANKYRDRVCRFFDGMLYSGNGSCERPYISLWSKEYSNFASYLGYQSTGNHSMGTCAGQMAEFAEMKNAGTGKTENLCFNLKLIYMKTTSR